ncbi:MAG: hypothetical protein HN576_09980 [Bacteriovoracaceae bacterium]|jgi:hypothetical protein|nr:hypothetical protein [Bacteriovoracaceae bacterium]
MRLITIITLLLFISSAFGVEVFQFTNIIVDRDNNVIHRFKPNSELFLFENEMVLAQHGDSTYYYDLFGNVKWKRKLDIHHHATYDSEKNEIWALTFDVRRYNKRRVAFDSILILDPESGATKREYPLFNLLTKIKKHAQNSELENKNKALNTMIDLDERLQGKAEHVYLNTNYFQMITADNQDNKSIVFKEGNIVVSFNLIDVFMVVNPSFSKILWTSSKKSVLQQHTPTYTKNGKFLVYDNGLNKKREQSRIVILDVNTNKYKKIYPLKKKDEFYSELSGGAFYTKKGTIVFNNPSKESNNIIEIDSSGKVLWRYDFQSGENGYRVNPVEISKKTYRSLLRQEKIKQ